IGDEYMTLSISIWANSLTSYNRPYYPKSPDRCHRPPSLDARRSKAEIARVPENPSCYERHPAPKSGSQNFETLAPISDERRPDRQDYRRRGPPLPHAPTFRPTSGRLFSSAANSHHDFGAKLSNR